MGLASRDPTWPGQCGGKQEEEKGLDQKKLVENHFSLRRIMDLSRDPPPNKKAPRLPFPTAGMKKLKQDQDQ
jgi:hypothetical protein